MAVEFTLPELGENVDKGDVVRVLVSEGDAIEKDQPVLELETDKATIEVPSSLAGTVKEVRVKPGDKVTVGQAVLLIENGASGGSAAPAKAESSAGESSEADGGAAGADQPPAAREREAPASDAERRKAAEVVDIARARQAPADAPPERTEPPAAPAASGSDPAGAPASPSVRRFARELGIDITGVSGTGPGGRIGQDDVKAHVKAQMTRGGGAARAVSAPLPDFSRWGAVESKPMSGIRRKTAEHLSAAWLAPHVTQHDRADVTELDAFRKAHAKRVEKAGAKLTITAILIRVAAEAIRRFPQFASSVDMANEAIVFKQYCHIGVAVDTPNGLLVPVIRDADRKSITEIAVELADRSARARDRKLSLDDMAGGVFTVTNLGGIGGTSFTPIINQPEVAILGVSRGAIEPVWRDGQFVPREMLPLSLSYDHRVIDGADAIRFLRFVVEALEQPMSVFL